MEWVNRFRGQGNAQRNGAPPAYSSIVKRSIRPAVLASTFASSLYLILIGGSSIKSGTDTNISGATKLFYILIGILCLVAAVIEVFGFAGAVTRKLAWAKLYARLSTVAFGLSLAAEVLAIVMHFTRKSDLISACTTENTGSVVSSGWSSWFGGSSSSSDSDPLTASEAEADCSSEWSRDTSILIIWLVILVLVGLLFIHFAFAFVRDLKSNTDPAYRRANNLPAASGYSSAFTYDDEASPFDHDRYDASGDHAYYEMDPQNSNGYAYPPPSGPPPVRSNSVATSADAPEYEPPAPGRKSMASIDLDGDRKDPNGPGGSRGYGNGDAYDQYAADHSLGYEYANRPGSSRSVRRDPFDEDVPSAEGARKSDDTLREGERESSPTPRI